MIIKAFLITALLYVAYQDIKDRYVYWFLFPLIGVTCGILYFQNSTFNLFYYNIATNVLFVLSLVLVILIYSKFKLQISFFKSIGLGDLLFFLSVCLTFSSITFVVVFVSALCFSLVLHLFTKKYSKYSTIPLAGFMSLFFGMTYLAHWSGIIDSLYLF